MAPQYLPPKPFGAFPPVSESHIYRFPQCVSLHTFTNTTAHYLLTVFMVAISVPRAAMVLAEVRMRFGPDSYPVRLGVGGHSCIGRPVACTCLGFPD